MHKSMLIVLNNALLISNLVLDSVFAIMWPMYACYNDVFLPMLRAYKVGCFCEGEKWLNVNFEGKWPRIEVERINRNQGYGFYKILFLLPATSNILHVFNIKKNTICNHNLLNNSSYYP